MTLFELAVLGVGVTALAGLGVSLGATIMWRLVHRAEPPPLPPWVSVVTVCSFALLAAASAALEMWVSALSMGLLGAAGGVLSLEYARRRRSGRDKST